MTAIAVTSFPRVDAGLTRACDSGALDVDTGQPTASRTVAELARAAIAGDRDAFGELIDRHERVALAMAYGHCGDASKAADAVQEACLLAWRKRSSLSDPARFSGWLMGIVRRCAIDQVRRGLMRVPPPESMSIGDTHHPSEAMEQAERRAQIEAALAELDDTTRVAVAMRYYDDSPSREIADALGWYAGGGRHAAQTRSRHAQDQARPLVHP